MFLQLWKLTAIYNQIMLKTGVKHQITSPHQSEHRSGFSVQIPSDVVVGILYAIDTKTEHLVSRRGKV